jgi:O-antigen/teichoic acid export membrane protein
MRHIKQFLLSKSSNNIACLNILSALLLNGLNFFTLPLFSRLLGADHYGRVSLYTTWVSILTILISLQAGSAIGSALQVFKPDQIKKYLSGTMSVITVNFAVFLCIMAAGMPLWIRMTGFHQNVLSVMLVHSLGAAYINFSSLRFTHGKAALLNFILSGSVSVCSVVLSLVFICVFCDEDSLYLGRIAGLAVVNGIAGICCYVVTLRQGRVFYHRDYWKFCFTYGVPLIFHGLSHIILGQSDRIMLNYFSTERIVGIYSLSYTFSSVLNIIWTALNNTWVPFYYGYLKDGARTALLCRTKRYLTLYTIITMGFMLLAPEVYRLFAAREFWEGADLLPVLAVCHYSVFMYSFPVNFQFYNRKTGFVAVGTFSAAVLNIVLNCVLIPEFGMWGAAFATWISYVALFLFHQIISRYLAGADYHYRTALFLKYYMAAALMAGAIYVLKDCWQMRWGIACVLGVLFIKELRKEKTLF